MPELPEVETTCRGIEPHILNKRIKRLLVRQPQLRWPIPDNANKLIGLQFITAVERRAKYIIMRCTAEPPQQSQAKHDHPTKHQKQNHDLSAATPSSQTQTWIIIHLGMSGSLHLHNKQLPAGKHDHFDLQFDDKSYLRYRDPRRFGCCLIGTGEPLQHRLLQNLGPEPLTTAFNASYLQQKLQRRRINIKSAIMQQATVVGVGNIYACEALFMANIHPEQEASSISLSNLKKLVKSIKQVLRQAIAAGGTTLRDFTQASGKPGYFQQALQVYGRTNQACNQCSTSIDCITLGQRSTFYCPECQPNCNINNKTSSKTSCQTESP